MLSNTSCIIVWMYWTHCSSETMDAAPAEKQGKIL